MSTIIDLMSWDGSKYAADLAMRWSKIQGWGDYLEFGTYQGKSLTYYYHAANHFGLDDMRFFGFDSFEGLPETETCPRRPGGNKTAFHAGNYQCTQEELVKYLSENDVDMGRVALTPGFFNESLTDETKTKLGINSAAIINVDCDIYESTCDVLSFVTDLIRGGTLILFDDFLAYGGNPLAGERKACNEWLEQNPQIHLTEYFKYTYSGVAFIANIVDPSEKDKIFRHS